MLFRFVLVVWVWLVCLVGWLVAFSETGSLYVTLAVLEPIL